MQKKLLSLSGIKATLKALKGLNIMKIGFIGNGNMGGAIIGGILEHQLVQPKDIIVSDINESGLKLSAEKYGINISTDNKKAAEAEILFLAVKPNVVYGVIEEIRSVITDKTLIISIVAGQTLEKLEKAFDKNIKLIRVMPNTPALVGEAMSGIAPNKNVSEEEKNTVLDIFNNIGKGEFVEEYMMDAVTGISGSSPAYVFMLIEAMADAAVQGGLPRAKAYTFAAQAVLGSAKMVLDTGKHPGELKDMVCSPSGTTIDAVAVLESENFRGAIMKAIKACIEKSKSI